MLSQKAIKAKPHEAEDGTESLYMHIEGRLKRLEAKTEDELKAGSVSRSRSGTHWHERVGAKASPRIRPFLLRQVLRELSAAAVPYTTSRDGMVQDLLDHVPGTTVEQATALPDELKRGEGQVRLRHQKTKELLSASQPADLVSSLPRNKKAKEAGTTNATNTTTADAATSAVAGTTIATGATTTAAGATAAASATTAVSATTAMAGATRAAGVTTVGGAATAAAGATTTAAGATTAAVATNATNPTTAASATTAVAATAVAGATPAAGARNATNATTASGVTAAAGATTVADVFAHPFAYAFAQAVAATAAGATTAADALAHPFADAFAPAGATTAAAGGSTAAAGATTTTNATTAASATMAATRRSAWRHTKQQSSMQQLAESLSAVKTSLVAATPRQWLSPTRGTTPSYGYGLNGYGHYIGTSR